MALAGIRYDLRNLPGGPTSTPELYRACLEQCAWADEHGFDYAVLSEHHGSADGYLPAPLTLAAAACGRTSRLPFTIAAALLPLHDPVRFAEQVAVLDLASGGRVSIVISGGYRPEEFEMAGVDRSQRGALIEEYVGVLRQAWTGEPFTWRGRTIRVTPRPLSDPHPLVMLGGSAPAMAKRAARLHVGFFPPIDDASLADVYLDAAAAAGFESPFVMLPKGPGFVHVTDDPERDWARLEPYILHDARMYDEWQTPDVRSSVHVTGHDLKAARESGVYRVVTPEECVALAEELGPAGTILLHPLLAGLPPEIGWASLELFATKVLPRIR